MPPGPGGLASFHRRMEPRPIAILGASGSIGTTTLAVARAHPGLIRVAGLASLRRWRDLVGPAAEFVGIRLDSIQGTRAKRDEAFDEQ